MALRVENLIKKFGAQTVLNKISLEIAEGEILFVLGKSGTGKSVLLKNIVGLLKPDGGKIFLEEKEISALTEEEYFDVRKNAGWFFSTQLFLTLSQFTKTWHLDYVGTIPILKTSKFARVFANA
jgi:phospholipid/cholesterol/gamma-HCH transport system ATP-binding protein